MNADFSPQCSEEELDRLLQLGDAIRDAWTTGCCTDLLASLARHPQLAGAPAIILDLGYEAYARDFQAGQAPPLDDYVENFPPLCRPTLRTMLLADGLFREQTYLIDGSPGPPDRDQVKEQLDEELAFLRPLGSGATGTVFLAQEKKVGGRSVVVKLSAEGQREAATMGRLADPHIVPVLSVQPLAESVHLVRMPWYGGATLEGVLGRLDLETNGPPGDARAIVDAVEALRLADDPEVIEPAALRRAASRANYVEQVMDVGFQIALALEAVQKAGYTHCDLKPANVVVGPHGGVFLLDFNLSASNRPGEPWLGGTPAYMAPEQLQLLASGQAVLSGDRIDVYALGVILYKMLTGKHPGGALPDKHSFSHMCREMIRLRQGGFQPVRALNPGADRRAAKLVEKCLEPDPERRPPLDAVIRHFQTYFSWRRRAGRWLRRNLVRVVASFLCLVAIGVAGASYLTGPGAEEADPQHAGAAALAQGDYARAESYFTEALRREPDKSDILLSLARCQLAQGKKSSAQANLEQANRVDPANGLVLDYLAYSEANLLQPGPALVSAQKALDLGYESASLWNNRAYCRAQLSNSIDNLQESLEDLKRALALAPDSFAAHYNRAAFGHTLWLKKRNTTATPLAPAVLQDMLAAIRLRGDQASGKMYWEAASMSAAVATPPDQEDLTRELLLQAVDRGIDPEILIRNPLFKPFAGELRARKPKVPRPAAVGEVRLMEPLGR
jgi:tetratricopeptide (TPR) repeat protein